MEITEKKMHKFYDLFENVCKEMNTEYKCSSREMVQTIYTLYQLFSPYGFVSLDYKALAEFENKHSKEVFDLLKDKGTKYVYNLNHLRGLAVKYQKNNSNISFYVFIHAMDEIEIDIPEINNCKPIKAFYTIPAGIIGNKRVESIYKMENELGGSRDAFKNKKDLIAYIYKLGTNYFENNSYSRNYQSSNPIYVYNRKIELKNGSKTNYPICYIYFIGLLESDIVGLSSENLKFDSILKFKNETEQLVPYEIEYTTLNSIKEDKLEEIIKKEKNIIENDVPKQSVFKKVSEKGKQFINNIYNSATNVPEENEFQVINLSKNTAGNSTDTTTIQDYDQTYNTYKPQQQKRVKLKLDFPKDEVYRTHNNINKIITSTPEDRDRGVFY